MAELADDSGITFVQKYRIKSKGVESVLICPIPNTNYCVVKGEEHTSYMGGYFDTPEEAIDCEVVSLETRLSGIQQDIEWYGNVRQRVASGNYNFSA